MHRQNCCLEVARANQRVYHCNRLQQTAVKLEQPARIDEQVIATRCNTLQSILSCPRESTSNSMQHAATRCNTLQHTADYLEQPTRIDEQVLRLDIAVHHVAQVQIPQDIRYLRRILQHLCGVIHIFIDAWKYD